MTFKQVKLNLYPEDHKKIKQEAEKRSMTMAQYIRHLSHTRIVKDKNIISEYELKQIRALNQIGNNLNQIAKKLNQGQEVDSLVLDFLEEIKTKLEEL